MGTALSDEVDLFSLARFRALFETPWQPQRIRPGERRVVRREIPAEAFEPGEPVEPSDAARPAGRRVRLLGALPVCDDVAYEAERWDGLG